jgi:hypothetical protein
MEYTAGWVALLGSSAPFTTPALSTAFADEGSIPWPEGVAGSGGATVMQVAQIDIAGACATESPLW